MTAISNAPRQFLSWWGAELRALLPAAMLASRRVLPVYVISLEAGGGRLLDQKRAGLGANEAAATGIAPIAEIARDLVRRSNGVVAPEVGLRMRHDACFVRRVELPASAARDFPRLLALDLERATPFKPKDVYAAFQVQDDQPSPGMVAITQLIVKRAPVDRVIAEIEQAGIRVAAVDCWSADGSRALPVDFLERESDQGGARRSYAWPKVLAAIAAVQLATAAYLAIDRHETALGELQAQSSQLKKKVQAVREANLRAQAVSAEIDNFRRLRAANASRVAAIEEISRLLPDTAWVTDLKIEGANVSITGLAKSAMTLIPTLERSPVFVDAVSVAPLTFDQLEAKERFSIRVRMRAAGVAAELKPAEAAK